VSKKESLQVVEKRRSLKRNDYQIKADDLLISEQYLRGATMMEIVDIIEDQREYKLSISTISSSLAKMKEKWMVSSSGKIQTMVNQDLRKLDVIERDAWEAWEESKGSSKQVFKTTSKRKNQDGEMVGDVYEKVTKKHIVYQGNEKYLKLILDCIDKRQKMLGVIENININVNNTQNIQDNSKYNVQMITIMPSGDDPNKEI